MKTMNQESFRNIKDFLAVYPWNENFLGEEKPMDFLWNFDLDAPLDKLWEYLIDTSSFNKRMGLPPIHYEEKNGRMYGRTKNAGFNLEWEEVPWEWEYCKTLSNSRIYSKGFAKYVRSRYLVSPLSNNSTRLLVYFGWIPKNKIGEYVLKFGMPKINKDYQLVLDSIVDDIKKGQKSFSEMSLGSNSDLKSDSLSILSSGSISESDSNLRSDRNINPVSNLRDSMNEDTMEKIQEIKANFIKQEFDENLIDNLLNFVINGSEEDLHRIQIKKIAHQLNLSFQEILRFALYGCKNGLFTLSWDLICPHCRGVRNELKNLGDIPSEANCDVCDIDFSTTAKNSVEITFHVHPSIREIQKRFYCAAEPATKKHIYFQKIIEPQSTYKTNLTLDLGMYRIRSGNSKSYSLLEIASSSEKSATKNSLPANILESNDNHHQTDIYPLLKFNTEKLTDMEFNSTNIQFEIYNPKDRPLPFVVENRDEDQFALRPGDLLNFKEFRDLFSEESIATGITLDIGVQNVLFTDIVGSTQLYQKYGDSKAFSEVRKHFVEIYRIIEDHNGVVVKTIGDAVMASFSDPIQSFKSGVAIQDFFQNPRNSDLLRIRISIHSGTCLAVNFNNGIDYFGNTVNYASKLQNYADQGDIVISQEFYELQLIQKEISMYPDKFNIQKLEFTENWNPGSQKTAYKIHIPPEN